MENIPPVAHDYAANGRFALEWVIGSKAVKQDSACGIVSYASDYANETVGDPRYPFDLFRRIVTVRLETVNIVNGPPPLEIK